MLWAESLSEFGFANLLLSPRALCITLASCRDKFPLFSRSLSTTRVRSVKEIAFQPVGLGCFRPLNAI